MSSEMGVVAIEAIQEGAKLDAPALNHAMMAQQFELGLTHASESGAASFQEAEESRRKTVVTQQAHLQAAGIPEVEVRPAAHVHDIGKDIVSYMDGFSMRAKGYAAETNNAVSQLEANNPMRVAEKGAPNASSAPDAFDPASALRLMENTYEFSLEAHLLTNVTSQSTGIFNQLMKEQ